MCCQHPWHASLTHVRYDYHRCIHPPRPQTMEHPSNPSSGQNNATICVHLSRNGDHGQSQTGICHHFVTTTKKARRIRAAKCSYTIGGELFAGAGFEPAIPHVRDYEPEGFLFRLAPAYGLHTHLGRSIGLPREKNSFWRRPPRTFFRLGMLFLSTHAHLPR